MNWDHWVCRQARPGEGAEIARLFAKVQSAATLPMTIWSSPLAGVHVDDLLAGDEEHLRARFYVMSNGSQLGGVISHRWLDDSMFCDNVFVSRELRKAQLSSALIYESVFAYSEEFPCAAVAFDVFESERLLHSWYQRLRGQEQLRRAWWEIPLEESGAEGVLSGFEEAKPRLERWGFANVHVKTRLSSYNVGYLPGAYFRITDPAGASDPELHGALRRVDRTRNLFLLSPSTAEFASGIRVATSIRMKAELTAFLEAIFSHIPRRRVTDAGTHADAR